MLFAACHCFSPIRGASKSWNFSQHFHFSSAFFSQQILMLLTKVPFTRSHLLFALRIQFYFYREPWEPNSCWLLAPSRSSYFRLAISPQSRAFFACWMRNFPFLAMSRAVSFCGNAGEMFILLHPSHNNSIFATAHNQTNFTGGKHASVKWRLSFFVRT